MAQKKFKPRKSGKPLEKSDNGLDEQSKSVGGFKSYKPKDPIFKRGPNDSSWRTGDKLSTALAASLPFGVANGLEIPVNETRFVRFPGIMVIRALVTAGNASDYNSPLNLASRKVYSYIRQHNSGSKNYEANDVMLVFLAYQQALALLGWLQRLYKTICKFSSTDRYMPSRLVYAMQVDYDDIKKHQAELAWVIKWMGNAINSVAIPKMPIFTASYEAFLHIYTDDSSPRKQIYMLDAFNFGVYDPVLDDKGGGVKFGSQDKYEDYLSDSDNGLTYKDIYSMVHNVMDPLMGDQDVGIILGDIMKAYDEGSLFKVNAEDMGEISLEYSEEILQQIHNLKTLPIGFAYLNSYSQEPGTAGTAPYLKSNIVAATAAAASGEPINYMIDAFSDQPSPEEIVNCTALQARIKWHLDNSTPKKAIFESVTFDLLLPVSVDLYTSLAQTKEPEYSLASEFSDIKLLAFNINFSEGCAQALNFDWCPVALGYSVTQPNHLICVGDVRMVNFFEYTVHARIHENSILSLFSLIGK